MGLNTWGIYLFVQTLISYFITVNNYSFDLNGPIEISNATDSKEQSIVFSKIIYSKLILAIAGYLILELLLFIGVDTSVDSNIYRVSYLAVLFNSFFTAWLFQGLQRMAYVTVVVLFSRLIYLFLVFNYVNEKSDLLMLCLLNALSYFLFSFSLLFIIILKFKIHLVRVSLSHIGHSLISGFNIFLSNIMVNFYFTINFFFLKYFHGNDAVGIYGTAFKFFEVILRSASPINLAIFPYLSKFQDKLVLLKEQVKRLERYLLLLYISLSVLIILVATLIKYYWINNDLYTVPLNVFILLNLFTFTSPFGQYYTQLFAILDAGRNLLVITSLIAIVSLFLSLSLSYFLSYYGAALAIGITFVILVAVKHIKIKKLLHVKVY